ncbi:hypothetical protein BDA96_04G052000 [Sorghum bicolor]|uniref:Uncharacterized protein n=1 Tax=Sorghum bicolor TaxID=4558 RepID=A0A921R164_SORBI|nr:hypothetical protein BDA96_04G052000 [Sorghum bicolor]
MAVGDGEQQAHLAGRLCAAAPAQLPQWCGAPGRLLESSSGKDWMDQQKSPPLKRFGSIGDDWSCRCYTFLLVSSWWLDASEFPNRRMLACYESLTSQPTARSIRDPIQSGRGVVEPGGPFRLPT